MWTYFVHMKTASVRDLRNNFAKLEAWLAEGEQIQIEKRGEPFALLTALSASKPKVIQMPDFAARQKALWGDRMFSEAEVAEMRAYELEGEEG
jgi:antitoxin (DNA-binding transcriptional repressor) of toxin-antitoxin stability system